MSTLNATYSAGALRADPVPARQSVALDVGARSPASVPAGKAFADADLNSAYAILAAQFPDEAFSRASIGGPGAGKLQAGLAAALLAVIILMIAMNFS